MSVYYSAALDMIAVHLSVAGDRADRGKQARGTHPPTQPHRRTKKIFASKSQCKGFKELPGGHDEILKHSELDTV